MKMVFGRSYCAMKLFKVLVFDHHVFASVRKPSVIKGKVRHMLCGCAPKESSPDAKLCRMIP